MIIAVFSALFLPRSGSASRLVAGTLALTVFGACNAQSAEPPHVVAERGVERFALLCLAHMGQPEGTAAAARQAGLASLSGDALRRYDATQGWSTLVADRRASLLLHPDGNCSLLIDSLPLPFAFKAVEGKLSALSAGERLRSGKIGRDYALRYRNLPAMVSVVGSPGNESGEVSFKTLASDLPGQRASLPLAPPPAGPVTPPSPAVSTSPTPSATSPTAAALPPITATVRPVPAPAGAAATPPAPSVNPTTPVPFPPVAAAPSSTPPQLSTSPALSSSASTSKVDAGSPPSPFPAPGTAPTPGSALGNSAPVSQMPTSPTNSPSLAVANPPPVASVSVPTQAPVHSPQNSPVPSPAPNVAEAPVPNLPLFPAAPTAPGLSPDLLPPSPSVAATPVTPVDPDKPISEASLVAVFADSCLTTKGSYAALQAKADAQGWRAMLPAAARDGFDFSWLIVPGKGVRLGLFLDSLRQKCCVSAFPADPSLIRQAIDARLSLGTPTSQVSKLKEVYVYPTKDGLTVSADFERTEPNAVFANVCSRPKLP